MTRRGYLDWLRGLAVLIMIEAHTLDSWTRLDARSSTYGWAMVLAGYGAPFFMFLAGLGLTFGAGGRQRKGMADSEVVRYASNRGWQVLAFAFIFRLQSWLMGGGSPTSILKVDILNIMGPSMVVAALLWGAVRSRVWKACGLAAVAVACSMVTPLVREAEWVNTLTPTLAAYLRPVPGRTTFTFFPWAGFLLAGGAIGVWLDAARTASTERRATLLIGAAGAVAAIGGYAASFLPSIYPHSEYWTSSPTYFFVRLGIVMLSVPVAHAWCAAWTGWSPLQDFGRSSLFVYWVHVEIVYGAVTLWLHRALSLETALVAFVAFTGFMFAATKVKERVVAYWEEGPQAMPQSWSALHKTG